MNILGINAFHGDSSAVILRNGELIAAVEEERFRRNKHWAGFPTRSIRYCLEAAGIGISDVDHVAINQGRVIKGLESGVEVVLVGHEESVVDDAVTQPALPILKDVVLNTFLAGQRRDAQHCPGELVANAKADFPDQLRDLHPAIKIQQRATSR